MFLSVDGGRSRIYSSDTSQGAHRRCFLALMAGAPGSTALAPPRGGRRRCFLPLMVALLDLRHRLPEGHRRCPVTKW
jgi:hypothetical protein